jgi:activator of 2-hydroxyglutaryl-CoA dehydratase/predicted nucleotide-binding protein (sugar kinase/HSP70/actin superfamily)
VILKTDMTHLANKGEDRGRILAGLFDAVCENVQVLLRPGLSPSPVALLGGVSRARRVRDHFRQFLARHGMTVAEVPEEDALFHEALGCALNAARTPQPVPALDALLAPPPEGTLETRPPLAGFRGFVRRIPRPPAAAPGGPPRAVVLGLDIGSTGSKAVAVDATTREPVWESYAQTNGHPVGAAQGLVRAWLEGATGAGPVLAVGVTGSGREIVRSLVAACCGPSSVYVLNEIAAHAEGALYHDPRVDTIFEIGGQDAKYVRLAGGRVVDAAMNEACSAGTGSFIEEQGRKFAGIRDVVHLGETALAAPACVSLGQHCSVFMAEIIDEAAAAGAGTPEIIAGLYDSVIQNYLNRVKGSRPVGSVVFCQGMPFASNALAAAVARQTGSEVIVPPSPGTVGALGIARLAAKELAPDGRAPVDLRRVLDARVDRKERFVCRSVKGCGEPGNKCRIDRLHVAVAGERRSFTWGGGCALHDQGTRRRTLPDRAPDPFREREALVRAAAEGRDPAGGTEIRPAPPGAPRAAMTDEFALKELFPFFAAFVRTLGFELVVRTGADRTDLKRGIEGARVPYCAPMQLYHGLMEALAAERVDVLVAPMLRETVRSDGEPHAAVCPIAQASPDILRWDLAGERRPTLVSTVFDLGKGNLASEAFQAGCRRLAADLGRPEADWKAAWRAGLAAQSRFAEACLAIGRRAFAFCREQGVVPVVILGRAYTICNTVLNSNVPALLREQGALAIPVDCYPLGEDVPVFRPVYWGYGQRNLRVAHQIRRTPGVYSLYCSNYSCGPDSFLLHFYAHAMEGKPFAVIETDGHAGDAGTKTRVEAFLHCVHGDLRARDTSAAAPRDFARTAEAGPALRTIRSEGRLLLIPRMGPGGEALAACLRGTGVRAECLPMPDRETVLAGRRHTSGKECLPMCITLGSLLQRLERERDSAERFAFLMPTTCGPCRFGVYHLLHRIVLERLGWGDRVRLWSPSDRAYFEDLPAGLPALAFSGFMASDLLLEAYGDTLADETRPGAAREILARYQRELGETLERAGRRIGLGTALWQSAAGSLFGVTGLLRRAAADFAAVRGDRLLPVVLVAGEIYVRCDPFANDFVIEKLSRLGIRCRFAPINEWIEYCDHASRRAGTSGPGARLGGALRRRIQTRAYRLMADALGWPAHTPVAEMLRVAAPYLREALEGEAVLTVGGAVHAWREGQIDGVVSVGPLECMPNKIAEAQFVHVAEREGLQALTLPLNGDPVDPEILESFAFEVRARFRERLRGDASGVRHAHRPAGRPADNASPRRPSRA